MRFTFVILLFCCFGADAQMIIKAHANYRPYAAAAQNLLLDDYPNAAAAYSLRKLDKDYTGNCIRIRRVSDGVEQDIGFTSSGVLDTSAIRTFIGATGSAGVATWYDQSGQGRNATQSTVVLQPGIMSNGSFFIRSGRVAIAYDGTNDYLEAASTSGLTISPTSFYAVSSRGNTGNAIRTVFANGILAGERGYGIFYADQTNFAAQDRLYNQVRFQAGTQISTIGNYTNTINTNNLLFSTVTTTSNNTWYNGGNNVTETFSYSNNTTTQNITIGVRKTSNYDFYLNGTTSEIVIWQSDQSSNRTGIQNNINTYYSIY